MKSSHPFILHPNQVLAFAQGFSDKLKMIAQLSRAVCDDLQALADKKVKGDQIVALLGEVAVSVLLNGKVIPHEKLEEDVMVGTFKISVKTRRGNSRGWNVSSAISTVNPKAVDFLAFVHLEMDYSVDRIWLYPWPEIIEANRIEPKMVRNLARGYVFSVIPSKDKEYLIYLAT